MKKKLLFLVLSGLTFQLSATISQIRWGSSNTPLTGLTITWSNTGTQDSIDWGYTTAYEKPSAAGIKRAGYSTASYFKFVFPGTVTANTTLYYKLFDSNTKTWIPQKTFVTAKAENAVKFSFSALGDCRDDMAMLTKVSNLVVSKKPDLVLFSGDLTLSGNNANQYDAFFTAASNFLANSVVYHAQGNHDAGSTPWFTNMFDLPVTSGSNLYSAVKYGNAIFINLNSENPSGQTAWLQTTLAAAAADPSIMWKVISFHKPFFNIGLHAGDMNAYRSTWWKAFDDYGVDLILNGHDHNYQRSKPVNLKVSTTTPVAKYGSGVGEGRCQIICGGAGAGLYAVGSGADSWTVNTKNSINNFVNCVVDNCTMVITAYTSTGSVLETFTLDKTTSSLCTATGIVSKDLSEKFNPISVYPNPTSTIFTLNYSSELIGEGIIKIYDFNGKEVASEKIIKSKTEFEYKHDMSQFAKGVYTVSLMIGGQRDNALLIKE